MNESRKKAFAIKFLAELAKGTIKGIQNPVSALIIYQKQ